MNVTALLHQAVKNFRDTRPDGKNGAAGLSEYMGVGQASLSHKVSPTYPTAHCSPEEVVEICKLTGDHAPVQAMALQLGYALVPIAPTTEMSADEASRFAASAKEFGDFLAAASSSGKAPKDADMARIAKEFVEHIAASASLFSHVQALHEANKAAAASVRSLVDLPIRSMNQESA